MFATKDDTFKKTFIERDNLADLERDIKHDNAQVEAIFDNVVNGNLDKTTALGMLEDENKRYIEQLNFFSNMNEAFTLDFKHKTLPFIYTDYYTVSFDNIGRNYPTSRIKLEVEKDGDIFELHIDYSLLEDSKQISTMDFTTPNTFIKDFWQPAEGIDRYVFNEEAYNKNVDWVNCICDKERKGEETENCWYYCNYWKEVVAAALDIMIIRHKIDIVENFQQNVLQKAIEQLTSKDNTALISPSQAEQTDPKNDTPKNIDPKNHPWKHQFDKVCDIYPMFERDYWILIRNGYIEVTETGLKWTNATNGDLANYFIFRLDKEHRRRADWECITKLFILPTVVPLTLKNFASKKEYSKEFPRICKLLKIQLPK